MQIPSNDKCGILLHYIPSVIFSIQQEVCADNRDTDCDDNQNDEDEEHETIDVVNLICPERRKDKVPRSNHQQQNWQKCIQVHDIFTCLLSI